MSILEKPLPHPLDVVTLGEAMVMFVADEIGPLEDVEYFTRRAAGAELNVATGLARLGLRTGWVSRIGNDSFGRFILATLAQAGIDQAQVTRDECYPTGFQLKNKAENGTDSIVEYFRKGSAASHLSPADFDTDYFGRARHLHLSGVAAALSPSSYALSQQAAEWMRAQGKTISFDPNLRPVLWPSQAEMIRQINSLAFAADWVLPGIQEGRLLTGREQPEAIADFYLDAGARLVVIKLGPEGAYYKDCQGTEGWSPVVPVTKVVDTVGAGDGFAVGVISALLEGLDLPAAVARATLIGALAIQVRGDSEGLPTREGLRLAEQQLSSAVV